MGEVDVGAWVCLLAGAASEDAAAVHVGEARPARPHRLAHAGGLLTGGLLLLTGGLLLIIIILLPVIAVGRIAVLVRAAAGELVVVLVVVEACGYGRAGKGCSTCAHERSRARTIARGWARAAWRAEAWRRRAIIRCFFGVPPAASLSSSLLAMIGSDEPPLARASALAREASCEWNASAAGGERQQVPRGGGWHALRF